MDIVKFLEDHNIDYKTEGHKHCRPGWVNMECPFCTGEHHGYHLGFPLDGKTFVCWRCGKHNLLKGVMGLTQLPKQESLRILKKYDKQTSYIKPKEQNIRTKAFKYPSNTEDIKKQHKKYLEGRGFDPEKIVKYWEILGTGPVSILKEDKKIIDYKHRIVAPIYWGGRIVSYQARFIYDGEHNAVKYLACPKSREIIHHKHILYTHPKYWEKMKGGTGICTEGITDVWRFGVRSFATFGIKYKKEQVRVIAKHLNRCAVIFDDEPQAVEQAKQLVEELLMFGVDAWRVPIVGDPGGMNQEEANYLIKQIL